MGLFAEKDNPLSGGAGTEGNQQIPGLGETDKALSQARGGTEDQPKRGRKPRAKSGGPGSGVSSDDAERARKDFAALMEVETFEAVVRFPADVGLMVTGREHFKLSDERVKPVALHAKIAASYWMVADPKYLSLALFGLGMMTLYAPLIAKELAFRRGQQEEGGQPQYET